jgi:integrase
MGAKARWNTDKQAWVVYINHKGNRRSKAFGQDKQAAKLFATEANLAIAKERFQIRTEEAAQTLAAFVSLKFIPQYEQKRSSLHNIQKELRNHVLPLLGHKMIGDITDDDVLLLIKTCKQKGLATNTIHNNIFPALSGVLSYAVTKKLIPANPCAKLGAHCVDADEIKHEVVPLTRDQAARLLDAAAQVCRHDHWVFILLLLRTGLRIGEAIALYWDALDLVGRTLRVKRNMSRGELTSPKKKQNRTVGLSRQLADALMIHKVNEEMKAKRAGRTSLYPFVFNTDGRYLRQHVFRSKAFDKAKRLAGLGEEVTPHWLRHTFVSQLLSGDPTATPPIAPRPIHEVSRLVGHNSITVTANTYGHLLPNRNASLMDALDDTRTHPPRILTGSENDEVQSYESLS